ncbi:hypothetical protein FRX31_019810 [Thalictrum thalictroides]|uniref:Uncharacterized protein n=1 Tax=Thalictrum thalictroides TaxID=46969 RepID=A0A7J6W0I9_THATH|nr:hypothetical protein FRX31_019810 [Thalictrum thalictroides]
MKFNVCAICGVDDDHPMSRCPWRQGCLSTNVVGPDAEIVCLCCDEDVKISHPNEKIIGRARLKESTFDCIRIRPPRSSLPRFAIIIKSMDFDEMAQSYGQIQRNRGRMLQLKQGSLVAADL